VGRGRTGERLAGVEPQRVGFDAWGAAGLARAGLTAGHRSSSGLGSGPAMADAARGRGSRDGHGGSGRGGGARQGKTGRVSALGSGGSPQREHDNGFDRRTLTPARLPLCLGVLFGI